MGRIRDALRARHEIYYELLLDNKDKTQALEYGAKKGFDNKRLVPVAEEVIDRAIRNGNWDKAKKVAHTYVSAERFRDVRVMELESLSRSHRETAAGKFGESHALLDEADRIDGLLRDYNRVETLSRELAAKIAAEARVREAEERLASDEREFAAAISSREPLHAQSVLKRLRSRISSEAWKEKRHSVGLLLYEFDFRSGYAEHAARTMHEYGISEEEARSIEQHVLKQNIWPRPA